MRYDGSEHACAAERHGTLDVEHTYQMHVGRDDDAGPALGCGPATERMIESSTEAATEYDHGRRTVVDDDAVHERETILLPVGVDDGERVETLAETAAEVAGMMETTVHVVHVFTADRLDRARERLNYDDDAPVDEAAKRVAPVRETMDALEAPLEMWGTTMSIGGRVGDDVGGEIVAAAEAVDAKRVLVGGRRRTPTGKVVFGSTAQRVLLEAPCPVTFVRDTSHG